MSRDYNFKKRLKKREQSRRRQIVNSTGYWPTQPKESVNHENHEYYIEGRRSVTKKNLKKLSNRTIRQTQIDKVGNNSNYKKKFDLWWE